MINYPIRKVGDGNSAQLSDPLERLKLIDSNGCCAYRLIVMGVAGGSNELPIPTRKLKLMDQSISFERLMSRLSRIQKSGVGD